MTTFITFISYVLLFIALVNTSDITRYVGYVLYVLQFLSYTTTFLANPGLPSKSLSLSNAENKEVSVKICNKCGIIVPPGKRVNHCEDCGVCIIGKIFFIFFNKKVMIIIVHGLQNV